MKLRFVAVFLITVLLLSGCSSNRTKPRGDNGPAECNWFLKVDETIPVKSEGGFTTDYTLVLIAVKEGGTDVTGTYEGAVYIGCKLDISEFSNGIIDMSGGFDIEAYGNDVVFDIVPYNGDTYVDYGLKEGELGLAPLLSYETMALLSPEMTGTGIIDPSIQGKPEGSVSAEFNESVSSKVPVPIKIAIQSGNVTVELPTFKIGRTFKGQVLGIPLEDTEEYEGSLDEIEALEKKASNKGKEPSDNDIGSGSFGGFGDIMGQIGSNLPLPGSFPADFIPIMKDADIFNVYESDDRKNVRVTYGLDIDYTEALEYYNKKFIDELDEKPYPIEMDNGIIYIFGAGDYQSITLIITEDTSKMHKTTVMIELSKR